MTSNSIGRVLFLGAVVAGLASLLLQSNDPLEPPLYEKILLHERFAQDNKADNTLTLQQIGDMRVRDIKRQLQRSHGFGNDEVAAMLDKQELIHALAFEEHKVRERKLKDQKRYVLQRGLIGVGLVVAIVFCWPLLTHAWEVAQVNFVVYTDRKWFECQRCYELRSVWGFVGIALMWVVDFLSFWLSASILASWVITKNKYFFPIPSLAIHPAQFMGGQVASGPLAKYGLNIGPMIISWGLRFLNGQIEKYTGKALASAQREQKKQRRDAETQEEKEERKARKAARKAAKQAAREQAEAMAQQQREMQQQFAAQAQAPGQPIFEPNPNKEPEQFETHSVKDFLGEEFDASAAGPEEEPNQEGGEGTSGLDDLD